VNRLWVKLTLAFLAISLAAIGVVAVIASRATGQQFRQYVVASGNRGQIAWTDALLEYYALNGSWEGVDRLLAQIGSGAGGNGRGMMMGMAGPNVAVADAGGRVLASRTGELVGEVLPAHVLAQGAPLILNGARVGTVLNVRPAEMMMDAAGEAFLRRVRTSLALAVALAAFLSLLLGILVSRALTAPLARLTRAAQAVEAGDLSQRVDVHSKDEIGELGEAFNSMTAGLAEAETLRRNLVADVSHELRTPLSVVQGNLQAILDGVYPLELEQIASLYDETRLLTHLVDDLHDLALADAGQLRLDFISLDLVALADRVVQQFSPAAAAAAVTVDTVNTASTVVVVGDADRLTQVLANLLSNALRHSPAGGRVTVTVSRENGQARVQVADTGPGIAAEDLPHIFERFYRGEKSRSRRGGGAGLGLAIASQLIVAHGGQITAASQPGAGSTFTVTLPAA
jgi:two-component system OmpR family sensor kinase/two-component system sensor histidine kinase BaeS